ncbi:hypothetical protein D0N36_19055 [Hymenobacter lapidiphilus]|uniref:hypothetical protein n=1 Tax=Hymenobacter sp. CCM 8763 TaxID=2303334 RepID=UPI000E34DE8C|nr:hypothetical protein [Hymenobacter sp. CCM 8763]RFP63486.1 hypothetical protein D0N36_19055 [Hymenobacter sp. CCM 8763]
MTDDSNAIETIVPAEQWEKLVQFYTRLLGQPQQPSDSEALFASPDDGLTIRLTKEDTTRELTNIPARPFKLEGGPDGLKKVQKEYDRLLKANAGNVFDSLAPIAQGPQGKECTIAFVWVGNPCRSKLVGHLEGVIHNPNWVV